MKIHIPKVAVFDVGQEPVPIFFLMGPIRGGGDWQIEACQILREFFKKEEFIVVVPNQWDESSILKKFFVSGPSANKISQTVWEREGLNLAGRTARRGCIIAWLPQESKTAPRDDGSPYARDTYGELGEWRGHLMCDENVRFALGAEEGFPGLEQIEKNFNSGLRTIFPIYPDLEMTVSAAIGIAVYNERSIPSRSQ